MHQEMNMCSHQKTTNVVKHFLYFTSFRKKNFFFLQRLSITACLNQKNSEWVIQKKKKPLRNKSFFK